MVAPHGLATRPTTDRVREALFSILGNLDGARVLDAWAGTGALGLEALSRGARSGVFVECARPALAALRANLTALGTRDARVLPVRVERAPAMIATAGPFDLVLADPPWIDVTEGRAANAIAQLVAAGALCGPDARVVLEHASSDASPAIDGLTFASRRVYGDTALSWYVPASA